MKFSVFFIAILLWSLTSCKEDENEKVNDVNSYLISETDFNGISVEIYSDTEKICTGYHNIMIKFKKDGKYIDVNINKLTPMMNMGMHSHTTPKEEYIKEGNEIHYPVIFIMPSGVGTYWYFDVEFEYEGVEYKGEAKFEVDENSNLQSFTYNEQMYFVSMITPRNPFKAKTGLNDFKLIVSKRESMMLFPFVEELEVVIIPWMPDMDHGSPMNENPISVGNGYYEGKVNFTMTGYWTVTSEFYLDGDKIGEVTHSFTF